MIAPEERFERYIEEATSSTLRKLGIRTGDPKIRIWALEHAAQVDARRGEGNLFGKRVLREVVTMAHSDYFVKGIEIPNETATGTAFVERTLHPESLDVLKAVMGAFGIQEGEGIAIQASEGGEGSNAATFWHGVPGVEYVQFATGVIAWPSKNTFVI